MTGQTLLTQSEPATAYARRGLSAGWRGLVRTALLVAAVGLLQAPLAAATPFDDYVNRVADAARRTAELMKKGDVREADAKAALQSVSELLPATEDIARGDEVVHVDNSWLHQAIRDVDWKDKEARATQLEEITGRLSMLERRLRESTEVGATADETQTQLQRILAREEYQPDAQQDSFLRAWLRKIQELIDRFLIWLFTRNNPAGTPSNTTVRLLRYLILGVTGLAALIGLALLFRRFRWQPKRRKTAAAEEVREVLGERLDAELTAEDLLREAAEMARKGDFRGAIRRAYIALLCELEQRGKLKLHRSKTNSDYLHELNPQTESYEQVADLTYQYERVWYGHSAATLEDYAGFIDQYREVAGGR